MQRIQEELNAQHLQLYAISTRALIQQNELPRISPHNTITSAN